MITIYAVFKNEEKVVLLIKVQGQRRQNCRFKN